MFASEFFVVLCLLSVGCLAQFKCPARTGFFPDPEQCDLYYVCSRGSYEEKLCPDGLVFDDTNPNKGKCDIPSNVDCGDRDVLQEAKPSKGCPRANGYYRHTDPEACDKFFNCVDGTPIEVSCPPGLIYDDVESTCSWPKESNRKDCGIIKRDSLEDGFSCPEEEALGPDGRLMPHPTYAHPDDCQKFYICRNGVRPQRGACPYGKVYSEDTFKCEDPKNVPGCEDYYAKDEKKPQGRSQ
ncbi:protein obstructor-E-like [Coccinella septempunctata]|uniref:protein obstructor-E-like n=1 Tax=Coccinella septempunctata TaxID=41139 RepID=UPI001D07C5E7|nr:protein obstructor-E-like [Coccinella septempunctata]